MRLSLAIAIAFVLLGLGYGILTPIFEQSDETLHYPVSKHIADGHGLPLAIPGQLWKQEGTQPPLYYALVAATTFWIDTDNLPEHLQENPHWLFTEVRLLLNDNQNRVLHGPMDGFPYQRAALAIHIGRWWSLLFGLLTVGATMLLARRLFPENPSLILMATALVAFNPQFLRISGTVSNDSLSAFLTTLAALLALWMYDRPPPYAWTNPVLLGLVCGLAILTKLSGLATIGLVGLVILWQNSPPTRPFNGRLIIRDGALLALTTLLVTGWWFYRNYLLYGEWFATETHLNLAGRGTLSLIEIWEQRAEIQRAYWGTFGWGQIRLPEWLYQTLSWLTMLGLIGLIFNLSRQGYRTMRRSSAYQPLLTMLFLLIWCAINLILYLRWVMEVGSVSHTRLMFPAIAAMGLLIALGWHTIVPQRVALWFSGFVALSLIAVNLYALFGLISPAFTPHQVTTINGDSTPLEITLLDGLTLTAASVSPQLIGDTFDVETAWHVTKPLTTQYSFSLVLLAPDGTVLTRRESYPGLGLRPTRYLQMGQTFVDIYRLRLQTSVTEPQVAALTLNLFDYHTAERVGLPAYSAQGQAITPIIGHIKITPSPWPKRKPQQPTWVNFDQKIALIGYDMPDCPTASSCPLTLYWQSLSPVEVDYVTFLHLFDDAGNFINGVDGPPTSNDYPTHWWAVDETIKDERQLPLTSEVTFIRLGLYDLASGQRLPIVDSQLPYQDNGATLIR